MMEYFDKIFWQNKLFSDEQTLFPATDMDFWNTSTDSSLCKSKEMKIELSNVNFHQLNS